MRSQRFLLAVAVLAFLGGTYPAHAYLDAGTGTMILQALAAGLVGVWVILRLYWYRLKAFFGLDKEPEGTKTASMGESDADGKGES